DRPRELGDPLQPRPGRLERDRLRGLTPSAIRRWRLLVLEDLEVTAAFGGSLSLPAWPRLRRGFGRRRHTLAPWRPRSPSSGSSSATAGSRRCAASTSPSRRA